MYYYIFLKKILLSDISEINMRYLLTEQTGPARRQLYLVKIYQLLYFLKFLYSSPCSQPLAFGDGLWLYMV